MKLLLPLLISIVLTASVQAQEKQEIYDITLDGVEQIEEAILEAKTSNKNVLTFFNHWSPKAIDPDSYKKK